MANTIMINVMDYKCRLIIDIIKNPFASTLPVPLFSTLFAIVRDDIIYIFLEASGILTDSHIFKLTVQIASVLFIQFPITLTEMRANEFCETVNHRNSHIYTGITK